MAPRVAFRPDQASGRSSLLAIGILHAGDDRPSPSDGLTLPMNTLCNDARMGIRPAATIVVARPGEPHGPRVEVLLLRRSARSRFAAGFVVFPGGVVEDGDAELAARWFGSRDELSRACAVRELAEETGLVATAGGLMEAPGRLPGDHGFPEPEPSFM